MDFDTLQVPYLSECRFNLQEDQETSAVGSDSEEEEEDVQQPVFGIDGRWRPWKGYPDIMR